MPKKLIILAVLAVAAGAFHLLTGRNDALDAFPHTFIATAGYEAEAVVIVVAPLATPPTAPEGLLPVWQCDDPVFADRQGRPWLMPVALDAQHNPVFPRHPKTGKAPSPERCRRYYTAEGQQHLDAFIQQRPKP